MKVLDNFAGLLRGFRSAFREPSVRRLLTLTSSLIFVGSLFYWWVEGWSLLDATYFSVITIATVGYGDLALKTVAGKIFTVVYVLCGIGLFFSSAAAFARHLVRRAREEESERQAHKPLHRRFDFDRGLSADRRKELRCEHFSATSSRKTASSRFCSASSWS